MDFYTIAVLVAAVFAGQIIGDIIGAYWPKYARKTYGNKYIAYVMNCLQSALIVLLVLNMHSWLLAAVLFVILVFFMTPITVYLCRKYPLQS